MLYIVYQTTNTVDGKIYVGVHRTPTLEDSYLGSGVDLKAALRQYGRDAFRREVLHVFDNEEDMFAKEKEIVDRAFLARKDTYNRQRGGRNPFQNVTHSHEDLSRWCRQGNQIQRDMAERDPSFKDFRRENGRKNFQKAHAEGKIRYDTFTGRKHTAETKQKMSRSMQGKQVGARNSQAGTCWVCMEGETPRKIKRADLHVFLDDGWQRGRKVK